MDLAYNLVLAARHKLRDHRTEDEQPRHRLRDGEAPNHSYRYHIAVANRSRSSEAEIDGSGQSSRTHVYRSAICNEVVVKRQTGEPIDTAKENDHRQIDGEKL